MVLIGAYVLKCQMGAIKVRITSGRVWRRMLSTSREDATRWFPPSAACPDVCMAKMSQASSVWKCEASVESLTGLSSWRSKAYLASRICATPWLVLAALGVYKDRKQWRREGWVHPLPNTFP